VVERLVRPYDLSLDALEIDASWSTMTAAEAALYDAALDIFEDNVRPFGDPSKLIKVEQRRFYEEAWNPYTHAILAIRRAGLTDSLLVGPLIAAYGRHVLRRAKMGLERGVKSLSQLPERDTADADVAARIATIHRLRKRGLSGRAIYRLLQEKHGLTVSWAAFHKCAQRRHLLPRRRSRRRRDQPPE
jgi:hypothetical protein